jgi:hypothetical protein
MGTNGSMNHERQRRGGMGTPVLFAPTSFAPVLSALTRCDFSGIPMNKSPAFPSKKRNGARCKGSPPASSASSTASAATPPLLFIDRFFHC